MDCVKNEISRGLRTAIKFSPPRGVAGGMKKSTWTVARESKRARTCIHTRTHHAFTHTYGGDRSRPRAGQWRFTPVPRVGRHSNPSPCHIYARVKSHTHVYVHHSRWALSRASRGGRGWKRRKRTKEQNTMRGGWRRPREDEKGGGYFFHPWTSPIDRGVLRPDETHPLSARFLPVPPLCHLPDSSTYSLSPQPPTEAAVPVI